MKEYYKKGYVRHLVVMTALLHISIFVCVQGWINPGMKHLAEDVVRFSSESIMSILFLAVSLCLFSFAAGFVNEGIQKRLKKASFDINDAYATSFAGITVLPLLNFEGLPEIISLIVSGIITLYFVWYLFKLFRGLKFRVPLLKIK